MDKIIIKDDKELKKMEQEISELKKRIEELSEVKLLKEKRRQETELIRRIKELSTYNLEIIANIIAKLMTEFEGVPYTIEQSFLKDDYLISPKTKDICYGLSYRLKKIRSETEFFIDENEELLCYLPPSFFSSDNNKKIENKKNFYIKNFIDFLYEKRASNSYSKITNEMLESILQEFLSITKDLQKQRKKEIKKAIEERLKRKKKV